MKDGLIKDIKAVQPKRDIYREIKDMKDFEVIEYLIEERQLAWEKQRDNGNPRFR